MAAAYTKAQQRRRRKNRAEIKRQKQAEEADLSTRGVIRMVEERLAQEAAMREKERQKPLRRAWLDRYRDEQVISIEQHTAGERYFADWRTAGLDPTASKLDSAIVSNQRSMPGCGPTYTAYKDACRALGVQLSSVVESVCCFNESCAHWEKRWTLPQYSGVECLRDGLDVLVVHYRK